MSDSRIPPTLSAASSRVGTAPSGRGKTIATRLPKSEMEAVEAAAKAAGKSASVWLREAAIAHLNRPVETRKTLPDPTLLAEILGLRNLTINLLSAVAVDLPKETIQRIVTHADATKQGKAEEVLRRLQDELDAGKAAK
jgi:hypothetical protein